MIFTSLKKTTYQRSKCQKKTRNTQQYNQQSKDLDRQEKQMTRETWNTNIDPQENQTTEEKMGYSTILHSSIILTL